MKTQTIGQFLLYFSLSLSILAGCKPGSISVRGYDCNMNGSFETLKNGLPVNWWYCTMETVSNADFDILTDSVVFKEGKRSLKFQVRSCQNIGGARSPGFFEEFKVQPGEKYKISFWVINDGCNFKVSAGTGMKGNPGPTKALVRTQETMPDWKYFEYYFDIPQANDNIRFEVNVLSPGTIWFDDIRIEGINDGRELKLYPYRGSEECE